MANVAAKIFDGERRASLRPEPAQWEYATRFHGKLANSFESSDDSESQKCKRNACFSGQ